MDAIGNTNGNAPEKKKRKPKEWPEWAAKHRTKNTELREICGRIYLYRYSSKYSPDLKRSKKISGALIGRITEEQGLLPKGTRAPRKRRVCRDELCLPKISDNKEYGISFWMDKCIKPKYYDELESKFGPVWQTVVGIAFSRLVFQSPICEMHRHVSNSFMSELLPSARMDDKSVSEVLDWIGRNRGCQVSFFQHYLDKGETLIWDGSDFESRSEKMPCVQYTKLKDGRFGYGNNVMMAFSVKQQIPVYMRNLPGDVKDIKAFGFCCNEIGIDSATSIIDKGFSSVENARTLDGMGFGFIMPLKRSVQMDYSVLRARRFIPGVNGVFTHEGRNIRYAKCGKWNGFTAYMYLDEELETKERHDALARLQDKLSEIKAKKLESEEKAHRESEKKKAGKKTFSDKPSKPDLDEIQDFEYTGKTEEQLWEEYYGREEKFGTIILVTNSDMDEEKTYRDYKVRDQVEKMYDVLKNVIGADVSHMQNKYVYDGWMFCNFLALVWYYRLKHLIDEAKISNHYSPQDILGELGYHQIVKVNGMWTTVERTNKKKNVLDKLGLIVTYETKRS